MDDKLGNLTAGDRAASWKKFMYSDTLPEDYSDFRRLLETYSKIPPEDVEAHIYRIVGSLPGVQSQLSRRTCLTSQQTHKNSATEHGK